MECFESVVPGNLVSYALTFFVDFRTKWIVLPYSESFSEKSKYIEAKSHQFSGNQEYNKTNSI